MKVYAVNIWLTLVHSTRSYDGSKKVELFFETPCRRCILCPIESVDRSVVMFMKILKNSR